MALKTLISIVLAGAALAVGAQSAFAMSDASDRGKQSSVGLYPDVIDRAVAQRQALAGGEPQWLQALNARSEALNRQHGIGEFERSTAIEAPAWMQALNARSEALNRQHGLGGYGVRDAFERAALQTKGPESTVATYPDVVERAVSGRVQSGGLPGHTDRYEVDLPSGPVGAPTTGSGREIEWPELGIGFGVGMLLVLGLILAVRFTRSRPLAHG